MKILERLPSLSRCPRWRVLCEGCQETHVLTCWKSEVRKNRSCALRGNRRGLFRSIATMALLASAACGGRPFTVLPDPALFSLGDDAGETDANAPAEADRVIGEGGSAPDGGGDSEASTLEAGPEGDARELPEADRRDASAEAGPELDARAPDAEVDGPPPLCCLTAAPCPDKSLPIPLPSGISGWSGTTLGSQCMPGVPGYGYCSGTVGVCP